MAIRPGMAKGPSVSSPSFSGLHWLQPVIDYFDPSGALPVGPGVGDRYIASATGSGWTINRIYEWDGLGWDEYIPSDGDAVWLMTPDELRVWTGTAWTQIGSLPIPANQVTYTNVGYPFIANAEDAFDYLLRVPPAIGALTGGGTYETGSTVADVNLAWTLSGNNPTLASLTGVPGFTAADALLLARAFIGVNLTTNKTYTLTVGDAILNPTSTKSTTVTFTNRWYWGTSANTSLSSAQILGLANSALSASRARTITLDGGGEYLYMCWKKSLGLSPAIYVGGFLNTDWVITTVSHTNASGYTEDYYVYRSTYTQSGTGITIQVT